MIKVPRLALACCYAGILIISAPASLLAPAIASNGQLSLANAKGTIWHGSATPVLHTDPHTSVALHTLQWKIEFQAMLKGQLKVVMNWEDAESAPPMLLTFGRQGLVLKNIQLNVPAGVIGDLSPFLKPAQLSGDLHITSEQLTLANHQLLGQAKAQWRDAGSAMSTIHPLGDYQIDITAARDNLSATLSTQKGALILDGQGNWSPAQRFHFNGTAKAAANAEETLNELLHHLGPESSPGVYQIIL